MPPNRGADVTLLARLTKPGKGGLDDLEVALEKLDAFAGIEGRFAELKSQLLPEMLTVFAEFFQRRAIFQAEISLDNQFGRFRHSQIPKKIIFRTIVHSAICPHATFPLQ